MNEQNCVPSQVRKSAKAHLSGYKTDTYEPNPLKILAYPVKFLPDPRKIKPDPLKVLPDFELIRYVDVSFVTAEMGLADFWIWVEVIKTLQKTEPHKIPVNQRVRAS